MKIHRTARLLIEAGSLAILLIVALLSDPAPDGVWLAYTGPGAGFAFLGSFLTLVSGLFLSIGSLLAWPFRMVLRVVRQGRGFRNAQVRKVIFLGLDGLDPRLAERFMAEGKMPNCSTLRQLGSYQRLRTTFPALSPVAWSTFATGVNPAKHNIFDFLNRNLKSYVPELSSSKVNGPRRIWKLGRLRIPLSPAHVEMKRKSKTFWKILGERWIGSTILRVPITFPPEKFNGKLLAAMGTPDLRGTQGSFSFFTTRAPEPGQTLDGRFPLTRAGEELQGVIEGPDNDLVAGAGKLRVPFQIMPAKGGHTATLQIQAERHLLRRGEYSPWVNLRFRTGIGISVKGIVRFLLTETEPEVSVYMTPINLDPEAPALPISHPSCYAAYLAKLLGAYATVGMAEDTWALNEGVIDEDAFLDQAYLLQAEREAMFMNALERTRRGVVACVFDTSDRVQHMFYRYLRPASASLENGAHQSKHAGVIEQLYQRMDRLVGEALRYVDEDTVLFVLSDHGFCDFRRGVNLNSWLLKNGYLTLKSGQSAGVSFFDGVDWRRTRAYTMGLAGLYLNIKGREAQGIVQAGAEAEALKRELVEKLSGFRDPQTGDLAIRTAYATSALYRGPYLEAAPDLIVGYADGYRTSWEAAVGKVTAEVFEDNNKAWSGDHCVDPHLVPGVLFCNRRVDASDPGLEDLAPTTLHLFGMEPPAWMEGKPLFHQGAEVTP